MLGDAEASLFEHRQHGQIARKRVRTEAGTSAITNVRRQMLKYQGANTPSLMIGCHRKPDLSRLGVQQL